MAKYPIRNQSLIKTLAFININEIYLGIRLRKYAQKLDTFSILLYILTIMLNSNYIKSKSTRNSVLYPSRMSIICLRNPVILAAVPCRISGSAVNYLSLSGHHNYPMSHE